ncbi:hypothetical protein VP01_11519g1, partial [Puccinia sorghi]
SGLPVGGDNKLEFSAFRLLLSQQYLSLLALDVPFPPTAYTICRAIAIVGRPGLNKLSHNRDSSPSVEPCGSHALVVFPPDDATSQQPVHALVVGPDSASCREDEQAVDPRRLLEPVLGHLISSASLKTLQDLLCCSAFYTQP